MKTCWYNLFIMLQIVICHETGRIYGDVEWRNTRRERKCLTSRGKTGVCIPSSACESYVSDSNINNLLRRDCYPMVCCPITRQWLYDSLSRLRSSHALLIAPLEFVRNRTSSNNLRRVINMQSFIRRPNPDSRSPESLTDTGSAYSVRSYSSKISSISSSKSVPVSLPAHIKETNASSSRQLFSNALLTTARPESGYSDSVALIRNIRSTNSRQSLSNITSSPFSSKSGSRNYVPSISNTLSYNFVHLLFNSVPASAKKVPEEMTFTTNDNSSTVNFNSLSNSSTNVETSTKNVTISSVPITIANSNLMRNDYATAFPEPPICGVSQGAFGRVVGGNNASLGDFPWIGVIAYRVSGGFKFKCGASLITSQHALTAAHCIYGFEDTLHFVRLGELDFTDHSQTRPVDAVVKTMIKHEQYSATELTNDIGILVFYRRVIFTDLIKPICMPLSDELRSKDFVNYRPFIAGWGRTSYQGPASTRLQMLQIPVVTQDRCKEAYATIKFLVIDQRVICAGGEGGKDACHGDSGGPLMQPIWDSTNYTTYFYQTGVVSLGMKCGTPGYPAVYTRVTEFLPWIQKHVLGTDLS